MDALSSAWNYASSSINSLMGVEGELAVVDPSSKEAGTSSLQDSQDKKRQAAFASYRDYIGMDITSLVQLPLFIMEPYTMLQKVAEIMEYTELLDRAAATADPYERRHAVSSMEYTELLDRAAATADPYERLAWIAGFCLGPFGSNERTWKPFNPILGETFEVDRPNGVRFLAEQVSHHPPIAAAHAENKLWTYDIVSAPTTRFLGNSVDIFPVGRSRIALRETGEVFSLVPPNSKAHNVIMGRTWVDCYGTFTLVNASSGATCSLYFTPCGWFSYGRYEVLGHISTPEGKKVLRLSGLWNSRLDMVPCDEEGEALPDATPTNLWTCKDKPEGEKYGFSHFALELCSGKGLNPLPSDSRRRADRHALHEGDTGKAGHVKQALEDQQRAEKKARAGKDWQPRWFRPASDKTIYPGEATEEECPMWDFTGSYLQQHPQKTSEGDSTGRDFNPFQSSSVLQ